MTIQRQYSLPNCTLTLEGLGDALVLNPVDLRPLLSILINAECRLTALEKPVSGGREFLDSLVSAVSQYAQEVLSGLHSVNPSKPSNQLVQLHRIDENTHRLNVRSQPVDGIITDQSVTEVDLNTVQLFDLVEAVDQLLADTQTLPDLSFDLKPMTRRQVAKAEPLGKRVVPVAIGVSGLAAAAIAFSLLPVPKVDVPKDLYPERGANATAGKSPSPSAPPTTGSSPSPTSSSAASPSPTASASPDLKKLEATLTASPEITDATKLDKLGAQLREKVDQSWVARDSLPNTLIYQVGMSEGGELLGYKPINQVSLENANKTPLLDLVYRRGDRPTSEPLAQFKVVFTPSGVVEVAPWRQVMISPVSGITEITEAAKLEAILPKLRTKLNQSWTGTPSFTEDLIFKVRVKEDGSVVDYSPENDAAARYVQNTPLAKLGKPIADGNSASTEEPLALYKVVFSAPNGAIEINPWRGWQN